MDPIKEVIRHYSDFTEGSFLNAKESMLCWNYKEADPEFGYWQATELKAHLLKYFGYFEIEII